MDLLFYLQLVFVVVANMLAYGHCFCSTEYDSYVGTYVRSGGVGTAGWTQIFLRGLISKSTSIQNILQTSGR